MNGTLTEFFFFRFGGLIFRELGSTRKYFQAAGEQPKFLEFHGAGSNELMKNILGSLGRKVIFRGGGGGSPSPGRAS